MGWRKNAVVDQESNFQPLHGTSFLYIQEQLPCPRKSVTVQVGSMTYTNFPSNICRLCKVLFFHIVHSPEQMHQLHNIKPLPCQQRLLRAILAFFHPNIKFLIWQYTQFEAHSSIQYQNTDTSCLIQDIYCFHGGTFVKRIMAQGSRFTENHRLMTFTHKKVSYLTNQNSV